MLSISDYISQKHLSNPMTTKGNTADVPPYS
jgi:hypothetical protein